MNEQIYRAIANLEIDIEASNRTPEARAHFARLDEIMAQCTPAQIQTFAKAEKLGKFRADDFADGHLLISNQTRELRINAAGGWA